MTNSRLRFINFLFKECSGLNYVLLKYTYADLLEIPSDEIFEILIDKEDYNSLLYVISSTKERPIIKTEKKVGAQLIKLIFADHSSVELKIIIAVENKGIVFMDAKEILKNAFLSKQNIKIPSPAHQFEYIFISAVLIKTDVAEKFRNYFSKFSFEQRSKIFAHICPKYKFVLNTLDELYLFSESHYHKAKTIVKAQKQNRGINYFIHKLFFFYTNLFYAITSGISIFKSKNNEESLLSKSNAEVKNILQRNSLIRN